MAGQTLTYDPSTNTFRVATTPDESQPWVVQWADVATQSELDAIAHRGTTAPDPAVVTFWLDTTDPDNPTLKFYDSNADTWSPVLGSLGLMGYGAGDYS
jgi:hypothetical protein